MKLRIISMVAGALAAVAMGTGCSQSTPGGFTGGAQVAQVEVQSSGFVPSSVYVPAGQVSHVRFVRKTDQTCAKEVVFPDLGVEKKLPLDQPVDVEIPAGSARTLAFACGMDMLKGKVVVQ